MTLISVADFAERTGLIRQSVHYHIKKGNITSTKIGGVYLIEEQEVDRYLESEHFYPGARTRESNQDEKNA